MMTSADDFRYLGIVLGIIISIAGVIGNSLAIAAYLSNKQMRTTFNMLVVSLSIVDFIISFFILPMIVYGYFAMEWPFPPVTCSIFAYFYHASHYTSAVFLVVISFNRFMRVVRPHSNYRVIFSAKGRRTIEILAWSFSLFCLFPLLFTDGFGWWQKGLICTFTRINPFSDVYSMIVRVLFQLLPLLCMMVLYGMIFYTVRKSHASVDNPRITVSGCGSFACSIDTRTTLGTPVQTPNRNSPTQPPFKHQISYEGISPSTKSTVLKTPESDLQSNWSPGIPALNESDSQRKIEINEWEIPKVSSDHKEAELQTSCNQVRQVCSENVADEHFALPHVPELSKTTSPEHYPQGLKARSVTFSNFNNILHRSTPRISLDGRQQLQLSHKKEKELEQSENGRPHLYAPQRPRRLSISPDYYQTNSRALPSNKARRRSNTTSLPNLERSRSISTSFSNMMDFVRQQRESRKLRKSAQHAKAQRKLLYMCTVICSAFALCSLPSLFLNLSTNYDSSPPEVFMVMTNLSWLTSMINPIVYAAMNAQFRQEYSRLLHKLLFCLRRKDKGSSKIHTVKSNNHDHSGNNLSTTKATMRASEASLR